MEYTVSGCKDCVFCIYSDKGGNRCIHPSIEDSHNDIIDNDSDYCLITPDWCPLEKESITIIKK